MMWPTCPDCHTTLDISPDQSVCSWSLTDPDHGDQTWWDCPHCKATWEDEEL